MIGRKLIHYAEVDSTNSVADQLARCGEPAGTVVTANSQTHGQGRLDRRWFSPPDGGLWFTVILRPKTEPEITVQMTLLAAVAVCIGIEKATGIRPGIKWPNDLLVRGKKICGILCEMEAAETVEYVLLGIGINANVKEQDFGADLQTTATSLALESGRNVDGVQLLQEVLNQLELWYDRWLTEGFSVLRKAWKERNITLNRQIEVDCGDTVVVGQAIDIDGEGALLVQTLDGSEQRFLFGEVSIRCLEGSDQSCG